MTQVSNKKDQLFGQLGRLRRACGDQSKRHGEIELHRIREYIANNPLQWELDRENPLRISDGVRRKDEPWEV